MAEQSGYDKTSIASIFNYSQKLIGHSLRELVSEEEQEASKLQGQGKGGLGQMIEEMFFHYPINSDPAPDFREAGMDLKATGLKKLLSGELQIKERLVCDIIDYEAVVNESFENSLFFIKCHIMLLIFYLYQKDVSKWDLRYIFTVVWRLPEKDLLIIKHDFEVIVSKIKEGKAHLLSEGDTEYLAACRKGNKETKPRKQPFSDILAPQRAFSLKQSYMRTVLEYIKQQGKSAVSNMELPELSEGLVTAEDLKSKSFEDIILERFKPFYGKSYLEICKSMGVKPSKSKSRIAIIANKIAANGLEGLKDNSVDNAEEFQKSGIRLKTVTAYSNGRVKEHTSFENIDYEEIYDEEEWLDSRLYEVFTSRFLFVQFQQPEGEFQKEYDLDRLLLKRVFFWTMPTDDIDTAEEYWQDIREHVLANKIELKNFWSPALHRKFHVRPKGKDSDDLAYNPNGGTAKKFCYWFNAEYVTDIIERQTEMELEKNLDETSDSTSSGVINEDDDEKNWVLCEPIAEYCQRTVPQFKQMNLFVPESKPSKEKDIRVVELFAGVGGFRIGLERASKRFNTVWNNQWEPSTKRQDASIVYCHRFGTEGHSNEDIATVPTSDIPDCDLLVGGFPCQDYSVATTLKRSGGIEGKKGVLWWQIYRILNESNHKPDYLFFENVDRLLKSPATQRGRDFAIILASLSNLGYIVEWRIVNAADYGMPQRRRRTYIVGYNKKSIIGKKILSAREWLLSKGTIAEAFPVTVTYKDLFSTFNIEGDLPEVSDKFNQGKTNSPFENTGIIIGRTVTTVNTMAKYDGPKLTLGQILLNEHDVPEEFFIPADELPKWEYLKGSKKLKRVNKQTGYEYDYSEGGMAFPDYLDRPSRTIITGEGGAAPSRFKHIVLCPSGRYRRLTPLELERLNMFPDNHTIGVSDIRRAFLLGNALVTGIIEKIGASLLMEAI